MRVQWSEPRAAALHTVSKSVHSVLMCIELGVHTTQAFFTFPLHIIFLLVHTFLYSFNLKVENDGTKFSKVDYDATS